MESGSGKKLQSNMKTLGGASKPIKPASPIQRPTSMQDRLEEARLQNSVNSRVNVDLIDMPTATKKAQELVVPTSEPVLDEYQGANLEGIAKITPDENSSLAKYLSNIAFRPKYVITDYNQILTIFRNCVVELTFIRRTNSDTRMRPDGKRPRSYTNQKRGDVRKMLCTSNWTVLNQLRSLYGYSGAFKRPRRGVSWYKFRGLLITWDLQYGGFRIISLDEWHIAAAVPFNDKDHIAAFGNVYSAVASNL